MSATVNVYNPTSSAVSLTPAAISYIQKELQKKSALGMYLGVKKSGCSGFAYVTDYVFQTMESHEMVTINEKVTIYIDKKSLPYLYGTQIDCVRDGLNTSLKFTNPNEKGSCGCGESFTV